MSVTLDDIDKKVLAAIEPEWDYLVLIIPSKAGVNEIAAATALATLKKAGFIKFEGRGRFKSVYLTSEGESARDELVA